MLTKKPVAEFSAVIFSVVIALVICMDPGFARAAGHFKMEKDSQGRVRAFKAVEVPLPEFVREYARVTSTVITVGGSWEQQLKGSVTLFLRRPLQSDQLTELFYRVLADNGYAVVDAPAGNGWIIERMRDARDAALPVYPAADVPDSARLVTAYYDLKYADGDGVARMMRSFMPPNSRIIPATDGKLFVTDSASNIRKISKIIARMDTREGAARQREAGVGAQPGEPRACGEQRIEKLIVEKLEIQDSGSSGKEGVKK